MSQHNRSDHPPSSDTTPREQYIPDNCVGFDVTADFAHFKKVGNNNAKPSYRIPPRTTVAGMLAGIMGMPRDSYYDLFAPDSSAVAIIPKELGHTHMMAITTVNTNQDAIQYLPLDKDWRDGAEMLAPESYLEYWNKPGKKAMVETPRQRDTYQMVVDPTYRIYVALRDEEVHQELQQRLEQSRYYYSPSLGLSECLAEIRNVDIHSVTATETNTVHSAVYNDSVVIPKAGVTIERERAPLYMEATDNGRRTTAFGTTTYATGSDSLPVDSGQTYSVGDHNVMFS